MLKTRKKGLKLKGLPMDQCHG